MLDRVRLHISPLTPELLPIVLPPSALAAASEVSYHTLQTFPERNYGYVELPVAEAQKLKKKLHGSILKGFKMKVEEARPKRKGKAVEGGGDGAKPDLDKKSTKVAKKRKREDGVLAGFELPEERRVKRGWTEPIAPSKISKSKRAGKDKKGEKKIKRKVESSKFTDGPECLFKTKVPQNAAEIVNTTAAVEETAKKKKSKKTASETVIHEFSSTTKHPSFLRSDKGSKAKKAVSEYVDGKGWVDEDGNVVEEAPKSQRAQRKQTTSKFLVHDHHRASQSRSKKTVENLEGSSITSDTSSASEADSDETSSSDTSSSEDEDDSDEGSATSVSNNTNTAAPLRIPIRDSTPAGNSTVDKAPSDASLSDEASEKQPPRGSADPTSAPVMKEKEKEVHPLEALFKRPKDKSKPNLEVRTTFRFFDTEPEDAEDADVVHPNLPQTPFTQRDYLSRRQRSAAPTPDTAAPSKIGFGPLWRGHGGDDSNESGEGEEDEHQENEHEHEKVKKSSIGKAGEGSSTSAPADGKDVGQPQQSEFAKWFWEHRGETNRAWKRRKREAAKEKRHKENKEREKNVV